MLPKEGKMNLPPLHIGHKQAPEAKQFAIQSRLFTIYISFLNNLILNVYEAWPNSVETIGQIHRCFSRKFKAVMGVVEDHHMQAVPDVLKHFMV